MNLIAVLEQVEVEQGDGNGLQELVVGIPTLDLLAEESGEVIDGTFEVVAYTGPELYFNVVLSAAVIAGLEVQDRTFVIDVFLLGNGIHQGQFGNLVVAVQV